MRRETQSKFFHSTYGWVDVATPLKNDSQEDKSAICHYCGENKDYDHIINRGVDENQKNCIEYWDRHKNHFNYNHLYRKRILKIKKEELDSVSNNAAKLLELVELKGEIKSQYVNQNEKRDLRGKGVWEVVNGEQDKVEEVIFDNTSQGVEISDSSENKADAVTEFLDCFSTSWLVKDESKNKEGEITEALPVVDLEEPLDQGKPQCIHREHKIRFTVPECLESESESGKSKNMVPTEFERCMKEMHEAKEKGEYTNQQSSDKGASHTEKDEDPWMKLIRYQIEKYGFTDFEPTSKKDINSENDNLSKEDIFKRIIDIIIKKEVGVRGKKEKIGDILGERNVHDLSQHFKEGSVTIKDNEGEYVKGLDVRKYQTEELDLKGTDTIEQVLEKLTTEWSEIGAFLHRLAWNVNDKSKGEHQSYPSSKECLAQNVKQLISEIQQTDTGNKEGLTTRDLHMEIKFDKDHSSQNSHSRRTVSKDLNTNPTKLSFREKTRKFVHTTKKGKQIMRQITKRNFAMVPFEDDKTTSDTSKQRKCIQQCLCETHTHREQENVCTSKKGEKTHRGLIELISGSKYAGSWNQLGMEGCGIYVSPGGTMIEGQMSDGQLDGPATVYLPCGMIIKGSFCQGELQSPKITFGDGLVYQNKDWQYLKPPNSGELSRGKKIPGLDRKVPTGYYDTGEGFYNPTTKLIYHPISMKPIRPATEREGKWIISACRRDKAGCVSMNKHLYESADVRDCWFGGNEEETTDGTKEADQIRSDKFETLNEIQFKFHNASPDRSIRVEEKSKPVELLWYNIKTLIGAQKAKVGVPFSYEHAVQYTCFEELKGDDIWQMRG